MEYISIPAGNTDRGWWLYGGLLVVVFINGDPGAGGRLVGGREETQIFGDVSPFFLNITFPPNRDS